MILESKYYKYPTLEERRDYAQKNKKLLRFQFESISLFNSFFNKKTDIEEIYEKNQLYYWNIVLSNRLGKLSETKLFLTTHFDRGFKERPLECKNQELVDRMLFDYFAEIFYNFFFSSLDTLAHVLNHFYNLNIEENKVSFGWILFSKINQLEIKNKLKEFNSSIKEAREFRNSFNHRFPVNHKDYRIKKEDNKTFSEGFGKIIPSKDIIKNINDSTNLFNGLLKELKSILER